MSYIGKLKIGTEVLVSNKDKFINKKAVVMFIGKLPGQADQFIGVQLQTPDGTHAGTFDGKEYFKAKQNHGMFAKPKAVKLLDGSPLTNLLTASTTNPTTTTTTGKTTTGTAKVPAKQQKKPAVTTKPPTTVTKKPSTVNQNKLSNQLKQVQVNLQMQNLKQELESAKAKIVVLQAMDFQQQLNAYRAKIRELQDQNRMLKVQEQKIKLKSTQNQQQKMKQIQQKIIFFNSQKQYQQKQKNDLKKKIQRLQQQLQQYQGNLEQFQKLTFKYQSLQAKNLKLKEELQNAKTQLRNTQMLKQGGSKFSTNSQADAGELEQLRENVKILNQTLSLMQGDLNEEKQKTTALQKQLQNLKNKGGDIAKLQKKIKSKDQQLQALKGQLQVCADAAAFAQKLTLNMLKKDQQLKQATSKLKEYLQKIESIQLQVSEARQMIDLQTQQLETQQDEIQKILNEKQQQNNHIVQLNKQINKYKSKISQLQDNNSQSQILDQSLAEDESYMKSIVNVSADGFRSKYHASLKSIQSLFNKYLQRQLQSSTIKNTVGVQMLNLIQTVPQSYTQKFYPDVIKVITDVKNANDKLYLLFDTICMFIKMKSDVFYSKDYSEIAHWIIVILEQIPLLYGQLKKIQLSITTAQTEEEVSDVLSNTILKQLIKKIDYYATQILQRFASDNIDASLNIDPFIDPVQDLDKICGHGRKLAYQFQTRNKLCVQTMATIHKIFQVILTFKQTSQFGQSVQVDTMIESFLKSLIQYLRECCNNPQLRIKTQTKHYLSGLELIIKIFEQIQLNQSISELGSIYSETQDIKMLKQTLLTTQFHLKQLINDLKQINYSSPLSPIKCLLSGKIWQQKAKQINSQLSRVQQLMHEKDQLQTNLTEAKKKILILQKQIKDRQTTKELYEKRIGQLQLKVQQASSLQNDNKRFQQKIKSYEDTNRLLQDQIQIQMKKRKDLQEQINRLKQKMQNSQTEFLTKSKKQKTTPKLSSEELTNLTLFKNVLTQCNKLRNKDLKKKMLKMKHSTLLVQLNPEKSKEQQLNKASNIRRKALQTMGEMKILDPRKKNQQNDSKIKLMSLQMEANSFNFDNFNSKIQKEKKIQLTELKIGSFFLKKAFENQNLNVNVAANKYKLLSY